jgi:hypothetical protein
MWNIIKNVELVLGYTYICDKKMQCLTYNYGQSQEIWISFKKNPLQFTKKSNISDKGIDNRAHRLSTPEAR